MCPSLKLQVRRSPMRPSPLQGQNHTRSVRQCSAAGEGPGTQSMPLQPSQPASLLTWPQSRAGQRPRPAQGGHSAAAAACAAAWPPHPAAPAAASAFHAPPGLQVAMGAGKLARCSNMLSKQASKQHCPSGSPGQPHWVQPQAVSFSGSATPLSSSAVGRRGPFDQLSSWVTPTWRETGYPACRPPAGAPFRMRRCSITSISPLIREEPPAGWQQQRVQ